MVNETAERKNQERIKSEQPVLSELTVTLDSQSDGPEWTEQSPEQCSHDTTQ